MIETYLCCCCKKFCKGLSKRQLHLQKFQKAREMLYQERDIEAYINMKRVFSLLVKRHLQTRQVQAVNFFNRYVLSERDLRWTPLIERSAPVVDDNIAEEMWAKLDPDYDEIDRIIMKEIINYKVQKDDNEESSSSDESAQDEIGPMDY